MFDLHGLQLWLWMANIKTMQKQLSRKYEEPIARNPIKPEQYNLISFHRLSFPIPIFWRISSVLQNISSMKGQYNLGDLVFQRAGAMTRPASYMSQCTYGPLLQLRGPRVCPSSWTCGTDRNEARWGFVNNPAPCCECFIGDNYYYLLLLENVWRLAAQVPLSSFSVFSWS